MTDADRITALEKTVVTLSDMLGLKFLNKSSNELKAALGPASALPGGRYPYILDSYQLHSAIDEMRTAPATPQPAPVVQPPAVVSPPVPAATGPTIAPLTDSDIARVNTAMNNGVNAGFPITPQRDQIASELAQGKYSLFNNSLIDAVKLWFYNGASPADKDALYKWLAIVDQRDPATNAQLTPSDPRVKQVSGSPALAPSVPVETTPVPAPTPLGGVTGEIVPGIFRNEFGQIGIGGMPPLDPRNGQPFLAYTLFLHNINPSYGTGIAYVVDTPGTDPQRPGEKLKRVGSDTLATDGGRRTNANGLYGSGQPDGEPWVPDGARPVWTFGADSKLDNNSFNCEKVERDPNRPGFNRRIPTVVNGVRVTAGQRAVMYMMGREDLDGGKEQIILASMQDGEEISVRKSVGAHNAVNVPI